MPELWNFVCISSGIFPHHIFSGTFISLIYFYGIPCGTGYSCFVFEPKSRYYFTMNISDLLKKKYQKHGKKAAAIFLVYFITKWGLTIFFGAKIITFFKGWL